MSKPIALALAHPDPGAREEAARAIVANGGPGAAAATAPLIAHPDIAVRNLAGDVLVRLGACAVDPVAALITDEDADVRKFAIDVLALLPAYDATDQAAAALDDADANVRLAAVDALATLGAWPYAERLAALYRTESLARPSVLGALATAHHPVAAELVVEALADEDPVLQLAAADALAALGEGALPLLTEALAREQGMARAIIVDAIVRWCEGNDADMPPAIEHDLIAMLDDPEADYRRSAARGLRRVADRLDTSALLAHAGHDDELDVAFFEILSARPDSFAALDAACAGMDPEPAASFIVALLAQGRVPDVARANALLEARYDSLSADTKIAVATLCARASHPDLHGVLRRALADPDSNVADAACDAVAAVGLTLSTPATL